jgi:hypothetical protein
LGCDGPIWFDFYPGRGAGLNFSCLLEWVRLKISLFIHKDKVWTGKFTGFSLITFSY